MDKGKVLTLSKKGLFFYAYETDAIVIHNLTNYQLSTNAHGQYKCAFPENTLGKILGKLSSLEISHRVYKPTKDDPLKLFTEKYYPDIGNYQKYSVLSDFSEAYDFLRDICQKSRDYQEQKNADPFGMMLVIDLKNENVCKYLSMIKDRLDERGGCL